MSKTIDRKGRVLAAWKRWDGDPASLTEDTLDNLLLVAYLSGMGDVVMSWPDDGRKAQILGIAEARDAPTSL